MYFKKLYSILLLCAGFAVFGQQSPIQTSIDSAKIKIGSQANLTLKATVTAKDRVNFPEGKVFGQLEVLESYPVDTVKKGSNYELVKKYGLTQFDTGRFVIPRLPVVINKKIVQTDSLLLEVAAVKVDTLTQKMYDIKGISKAGSDSTWLWWLLGVVLLVGAGFAAWWFFLRKKKPVEKKKPEVVITPIEKATAQLQSLEKKDLLQQGAVKEYYSELADIARQYIEEAIHIPAMESTTGELIEAMQRAAQRKKMPLRPETFEQLEQVLRTADMVKFAKSKPLDFEIAEDRSRIEKTIVVIDRSIPEEKPEDEDHTQRWLEAQRKKKEEKKRRTIIWSSVAAAVLLLLGITGYFGVGYLKENIFGTPTKELLEGQWVKSEYGFPGVSIETPEVLVRQDATKLLPPETMALIKDMTMFTEGAMFSDFYVVVSTANFKQPINVDLAKASEGVIKTMEAKGATEILVKTDEFKTQQGITGLRTYGTMNIKDQLTGKADRAYYEMYFFSQQGGLQQVMVLYRDGDVYSPQILERIKNSIELRNLSLTQQ